MRLFLAALLFLAAPVLAAGKPLDRIDPQLPGSARLTIDFAAGTYAIADRRETPPGKRLALTRRAGIETFAVRVNGRPARAALDLDTTEMTVSRALARKLDLKRVGHGRVELRTLELGGARYRKIVAKVDNRLRASDLRIGTAILKGFLVTTDYRARALWLEPVGRIGR